MPYIGDALYLETLDLEGCIQLEEIGLSIVLSRKLTYLNLKGCKSLIKLPKFGEDLILKVLDLEGCQKLRHIDPSIGLLKELTYLNLKGCKSLIKLPQFGEDLILKELDLKGCQKLRHIDPSIGLLKKLSYLNLENCKNLESLPNSIIGLNSLFYLNLSGCTKLYNIQLLYELRDAEHLEKIDIDGAPIHFQSTSSYSREHKKSVSCLMPSSPIFPCMRELDLSFCNLVQIPDAIGIICGLEQLDLSGNNFATLPNLKKLSELVCLKLQHCKHLKSLPELPSRIDEGRRTFSLKLLPANPRYRGRKAGLYIFNCPELVDREGCTDMALSWMIKLSQGQNKFMFYSFKIGSVTPGSEIPRWFNNQREGNCISLDASPVMHDDNWIGVAFCAIFAVPQTLSAMRFLEEIWTYPISEDIPVDFYVDKGLELVLDRSDHMWLFFVPRCQFIEKWHLKHRYLGKFVVEQLVMKDGNYEFLEKESFAGVKKFGYRWVYEEDIEELSNPPSRKRKFGTIEQNEGRNKDAATSSQENTINLLQNEFEHLSL